MLVNALRQWKLACPGTGLVFPGRSGRPLAHRILVETWQGVQRRAGLVVAGADGKLAAKYSGMHALRHFNASWLINPPDRGGLGLLPKIVQERLGHSTIGMTMDVYGHIFARGDDAAELAAAEKAFLTS
jgi:integrase